MSLQNLLDKTKEEFFEKFGYIQAIKNEKSGNSYTRISDFITQSQLAVIKEVIKMMPKYPCTCKPKSHCCFTLTNIINQLTIKDNE